MSKTREELMKEYNALLRMKEGVEKDLLKIPGVLSMSVGVKRTKGLVTEGLCFRIYVSKKKEPGELPVQDLIPKEINGIKTDVNEIAKNISLAASKADWGKYRPMSGGIMIVPAKHKKSSGTLGCFVIDDDATNDNDKVVLLTCHHVLMAHGEEAGHKVAQPSFRCDRSPCRCGEVAKLVRGHSHDKNVDCAIAKLSNGNGENWTNEVIELGPISCIPVNENKQPIDPFTKTPTMSDGSPYRPVLPNDRVFKRGAATRFTEGLVDDIVPEISFPGLNGVAFMRGQILIHPLDGGDPFGDLGDSGSVVLNHLNQVVGLLWSTDITSTPPEAYASPIQDVLQTLRITIPDTGTLETLPLKSKPNTSGSAKEDLEDKVKRLIEQQPDGRFIVELFKKHEDEIFQLVNTDREVTVAWNRNHGPSFVAYLMEKVMNNEHDIPGEIGAVTWQRLMSKMSVLLEKKGSRELASDIENYSAKAFLLIAGIFTSFKNKLDGQKSVWAH